MSATAWTVSAAPLETAREASTLRYEMAVGTDGRATSLKSIDQLPDDVDQRIQKRIRSYRFMPATMNGVAQPATTTLYLTLGPIKLPDGTAGYGITSLATGPRRLANQTRENLPRLSEAHYLIITYDQNGRVTGAEIEEAGQSSVSPRYRKWALGLVRSFKFVPETVAGIAVPAKVEMPLVFCASKPCPEPAPRTAETDKALAGDMVAESVLNLESPINDGSI